MKTILCPTDFSECAENAIAYAGQMAKVLDAEILLLHALHVPVVDAYTPPSTISTMMEEIREIAVKRIENRAEEINRDYHISVRTHVAFGLVFDLVETIEQEESINLVVMGTNGANNAIDAMLGTNAVKVMSHGSTPTLIIPQNAEFTGLSRVGYATDFTQDSDQHIEVFADLLRPFGSELVAVHVSGNTANDEEIEKMLQHFDHPSKPQTIKGENIVEELNAFVWEQNLGLMAMKRHKRNWFETIFHNSATKEMAQHSKVPVLIFN